MNRIEGLFINRVRKAGDKGYKLGAGYNASYTNAAEKFTESGKVVKKGNRYFATSKEDRAQLKVIKTDVPAETTGKKRGRPRKTETPVVAPVETPVAETPAPVVEPVSDVQA